MKTRMPQAHQQSKPAGLEEVKLSPPVVWKTKVTDKVSQTAVGSLFRRIASGSKREPMVQEGSLNDPGLPYTRYTRADRRYSTGCLHQLLDLDLD